MVLHLLTGSIRLLTGPFVLPSFTTPDPGILPISSLPLIFMVLCLSAGRWMFSASKTPCVRCRLGS
ncbi:hypothetical protein BDV40DRAFT_277018 [Aspergillus tamarii]|uniref:Uncharacterized protein n=1 Tax=Aspergillus tamarii TaxID=41984 RepID=A0A5N6UHD3_ASPTM|nr:hypothetical protein BDV40DRAFT_277018 [Aspergillus tamarii]